MSNPTENQGVGYLTPSEIEELCTPTIEGVTTSDVIIASDLVDGYLGRSYKPIQHKSRPSLRGRRGKLDYAPVVSIDSVQTITDTPFGRSKETGSVEDIDLDPENDGYFTYIGNNGFNRLIYGRQPVRLEITYTAGFAEYPSRLKTAVAMLACNIRQAQSFNGAKQLTSMDFQVLMTDDSFFTSDIKMLLKGLSA